MEAINKDAIYCKLGKILVDIHDINSINVLGEREDGFIVAEFICNGCTRLQGLSTYEDLNRIVKQKEGMGNEIQNSDNDDEELSGNDSDRINVGQDES